MSFFLPFLTPFLPMSPVFNPSHVPPLPPSQIYVLFFFDYCFTQTHKYINAINQVCVLYLCIIKGMITLYWVISWDAHS